MSELIPYSPEELEWFKREHSKDWTQLYCHGCRYKLPTIWPCPTVRLIKTVEGLSENHSNYVRELQGEQIESLREDLKVARGSENLAIERAEKAEKESEAHRKQRLQVGSQLHQVMNEDAAAYESLQAENAALKSKVEKVEQWLRFEKEQRAGEAAETLLIIESLRAEIAKLQGERDEAQGANILNRNAVKRLQAESERWGKALERISALYPEQWPAPKMQETYGHGKDNAFLYAATIAREALTPQPAEEKQGESLERERHTGEGPCGYPLCSLHPKP